MKTIPLPGPIALGFVLLASSFLPLSAATAPRPNVVVILTDDWKHIHYPHGDGSPDRYQAELYHIATDPLELHNLIAAPAAAAKLAELKKEHERLMRRHKAVPDHMPLDSGILNVLPKF